MRIAGSLCLAAALVAMSSACQKASPTAPGAVAQGIASVADASTTTAAKATLFTFTKIPVQPSDLTIAAGPDVRMYAFNLTTDRTKSIELSSLSFMINGSLQAGSLSNFRLVYYPGGLTKPGVVIATNDGVGWTPGPYPANFLTLRPSAFVLSQNFTGQFAVLADVSGSAFFFWSQLQTATVTVNGVEEPLLNPVTCDLPLMGDTFHVM